MRKSFSLITFIMLAVLGTLKPVWASTSSPFSVRVTNAEGKSPSTVTTSTISFTETVKADNEIIGYPRQIKIVHIKGAVSRKLLPNLKKTITPDAPDPIPAGLIVFLDSKGGDGMAAIQIGRILRAANAHVFVNGECSSACIFILAGGVVRSAPTFSVGIHQARVTVSSDAGVIKKEINAEEDPKGKALLEKFDALARKYLDDMSIPEDLLTEMQSHSSKRIYRLSSKQLTEYQLNGIEAEYLQERTHMYAQKTGRWPKDSEELTRRTSKVVVECLRYENNPVDFTKCYRRVLQDIY